MPAQIIEELKREIRTGRALIIAGSGVSLGATNANEFASWTGLLHNGATYCAELYPELATTWVKRVHEEIDSADIGDLLSAAEKVSEKLGAPHGGNFARWLRETVGTLRVQNGEIIEALCGLGGVLATTNYDSLITQVSQLPSVTWKNLPKVQRIIREKERAVIHLHGHWEAPESVVL